MFSLVVGLLACQVVADQTRSLEELDLRVKAQAEYARKGLDAATVEERLDFAERYDRLVHALQKFETDYRKGGGAVWPKRSADDLNKALRAFQSAAAWKQHA